MSNIQDENTGDSYTIVPSFIFCREDLPSYCPTCKGECQEKNTMERLAPPPLPKERDLK